MEGGGDDQEECVKERRGADAKRELEEEREKWKEVKDG